MSESLSVILPVQNAENQLQEIVTELLNVVSELTSDFELMIVDNGSTDDTEEVSMELARMYPQVNTFRQSEVTDEMVAARKGIARTSGDMVLIHDIHSPLSADAMRQFWGMRNDKELVFARSEIGHSTKQPRILQRRESGWSGTQMLRREAVNELQESSGTQMSATPTANETRAKIDRVTRTDLGVATSNPNSMLRKLTDTTVEQ